MELRHLLDVLRRHVWFVVRVVIVVGVAAGVLSNLRTPVYRATASVLLRPDDPAEQLNPSSTQRVATDPDRYVEAQKSIARSMAVAREAARMLHGVSGAEVARRISVEQGGRSDLLEVSATDTDPVRARDMANAVVEGFIENRRQSAVAGLQQAADEIQAKLLPLQQTIAQLDARIGDGSQSPDSTSTPQPVTPPPSGPVPPAIAPAAPGMDLGGQPTTAEALKAARYAAAVQYQTLFSRQQELLVDIALKRGEAELIDEATTPRDPVSPRPVRDTATGVGVGLLLGIGLALLREHAQNRIRSLEEIERLTSLPILAQLPFDEASTSEPAEVAVLTRPLSPLAEGVRSLRTSIRYLGADGPVKVLLVTSALPGEGKSLVAANLAAAHARAGHRTVLVSADLRRPGASRMFGVAASAPGLTNVVVQSFPADAADGDATLASNGPGTEVARTATAATVATSHRLLRYLPSGPTPPNPAELLGSRRMLEVVEELAASADVVVVDTPPLLPVTDAAVLAAKADGVLLVAAVGETRRDALNRAKAVLDGTKARVLGVVANKMPRTSGAYSYSYYVAPAREKRRRRRVSEDEQAAAVPDGSVGHAGTHLGAAEDLGAEPWPLGDFPPLETGPASGNGNANGTGNGNGHGHRPGSELAARDQ